jgi:hypothetical protein
MLTFLFDNYALGIPSSVYKNVASVLGLGRDDEIVRCDIKTTINIQVGDVTLTVTPDLYVRYDTEDADGNCYSRIYDSGFRLPISFLRSKCLLLNYQTRQVGLASSKQ